MSFTPNPIYGIPNPIYGIHNPIYGIHNPIGLKYLTRLRVGLRTHKHQYNFSDTSLKYCSCRDNLPETVEHYILHCPIYSLLRRELLGKLRLIVSLLTLTSSAYSPRVLAFNPDIIDNKPDFGIALANHIYINILKKSPSDRRELTPEFELTDSTF